MQDAAETPEAKAKPRLIHVIPEAPREGGLGLFRTRFHGGGRVRRSTQ